MVGQGQRKATKRRRCKASPSPPSSRSRSPSPDTSDDDESQAPPAQSQAVPLPASSIPTTNNLSSTPLPNLNWVNQLISPVQSIFGHELFGAVSNPPLNFGRPGPGFGPPGGPGGDDDFNPEPIDPNMGLEKIGGLEEQIAYLQRRILHPIMAGQPKTEIARAVLKPVKGVIFYGPPGTGKTVLAKALAATISKTVQKQVTFFMRKGTDVYSKWVGESEKNLRTLFAKADRLAPSIIFLDEIDGLCPARQDSAAQHQHTTSVVVTLLSLMDAVKPGNVYVIGATNRLSALDPAILRPGRFDQHLYFSAPNEAGRLQILNIKLNEWGNSKPKKELLQEVARVSVGYTGADLEKLISTALDLAVERQFPKFGTPGDTTKSTALEALQVIRVDWLKALATTSKSNPNVFGNSSYTGEVMNESVGPLIGHMVQEIRGRIESLTSETDVSLGNKGLLVWAQLDSTLLAIDKLLLPAVIGTMNTRKFPTFRLSLYGNTPIAEVLDQALHSARERPTILLIPRIDRLFMLLQAKNLADVLLESFEEARGKNLTIVASAICGLANLPGSLQRLFVVPDLMVYRLPAVTNAARKDFFAPLFDKNAKYHEKHGNNRCLSDLLCRVEKMTDGDDISKLTTLHGEITIACVQFYDSDCGSRNSAGYKTMIQKIGDLIENYEKAKADTCR